VSVGEEFEFVAPVQTTQTNDGRQMLLEPAAPAFHSPRPVWLCVGCLLLFYCGRFITFSAGFSSPGSVCTKHKNISRNDRATDAADMCGLKLNLVWFCRGFLR